MRLPTHRARPLERIFRAHDDSRRDGRGCRRRCGHLQPLHQQTVITFEEAPVSAAEIAGRIEGVRSLAFPWLVAEEAGRIVGYAYATKWRDRSAYRFSAESTVLSRPHGHGARTRLELVCAAVSHARGSRRPRGDGWHYASERGQRGAAREVRDAQGGPLRGGRDSNSIAGSMWATGNARSRPRRLAPFPQRGGSPLATRAPGVERRAPDGRSANGWARSRRR